jgi:tRNA nucleotidyltransferase (CCA-adding enzyme)
MKKYLVGGAVRDLVMGIEPKDKDYVVIGSSPAEMLSLGFKQVGADFPVFLHPETGDEYALARTERKQGTGYNGFVTVTKGVALEDDLARRDLTMNAMALDEETGKLFDPFNGAADIKNRTLRHVSMAFAEDPLRVLRLARFAARYDFQAAPETLELCRLLVTTGELGNLTYERCWKELLRALEEPKSENFFKILDSCGALGEEVPFFFKLFNDSSYFVIDHSSYFVIDQARAHDAYLARAPQNFLAVTSHLCYLEPGELKEESHLYKVAMAYSRAFSVVENNEAYTYVNFFKMPQKVYEDLLKCLLFTGQEYIREKLEAFHAACMTTTAEEVMLVEPTLKGKEIGDALQKLRIERVTQAMERTK